MLILSLLLAPILLPKPTGPHIVGTSVAYVVDSTRADADFKTGRPITVQLWYPAAERRGSLAPYLVERPLAAALLRQQYYTQDSATLTAWSKLRTHAYADARAAGGKYPLIAFSVGLGVIRANYTSIAEELASHGYVVALVESPLQGFMVLPNGREISDTAGRYGEPAQHSVGVESWSRDISFVLDELRGSHVSSIFTSVARSVDWARIGAAGHSSGGIVALATCNSDARVRACIDLDGGVGGPKQEPMAAFVATGLTKPAMILRSEPLYDDTTLARRGMTREEWVKRGEGGRLALEGFEARAKALLLVASIAGTGHFSFSDGPFVMPTTITRFGGRIIDRTIGWQVITQSIRAFFDQQLQHRGGVVLAVAKRFPQLSVKSFNGARVITPTRTPPR